MNFNSRASLKLTGLLALALVCAHKAQAFSSSSDSDRLLSVGGGISSPSITSALGENPAGLVNNRRSTFLGAVAAGNDQFNPLGFGGGFFTGNGSVGGGIILQGFNNNTDGASGSVLLLNWGLAAEFSSLNLAWGFTGTRTLTRSGEVHGTGSGTTWCVDTGLIYNPRGEHRLGFTLFQILDDIDAIGAGYSLDANSWATFALDASYTRGSNTTVLKPGLSFNLPGFKMSSGFGARVQGDGWSWIRQGLSLAVAVPLGQTIAVQFYFNQLARYYAGLTISL